MRINGKKIKHGQRYILQQDVYVFNSDFFSINQYCFVSQDMLDTALTVRYNKGDVFQAFNTDPKEWELLRENSSTHNIQQGNDLISLFGEPRLFKKVKKVTE